MDAHDALAEVLNENTRLRQKVMTLRYVIAGALTHHAPEGPTIEWFKSNFAETQYRIRKALEAAGEATL